MRIVPLAAGFAAVLACASTALAQDTPLFPPMGFLPLGGAGGMKARDPLTATQPDIAKAAAQAGQFKTLLNCLIAADLLDAIRADGPFLVFAPTDAAFDKLPKGTLETLLKPENKDQLAVILKYHVAPNPIDTIRPGEVNTPEPKKDPKARDTSFDKGDAGRTTLTGEAVTITTDAHGAIRVNDVPVKAQVRCRNGTVLVIDQVLMPPAKATIPAVAKKAGQFNTLLAALTAADLVDVLGGPGPFTVFAPTDAAFEKLPRGTVAALLKPENKATLVAILKYHVVAGKITAKDAVTAGTAKTLRGESVTAAIVDGRLTINKSAVIKSDVVAENGVIHIIDAVLIPKQ